MLSDVPAHRPGGDAVSSTRRPRSGFPRARRPGAAMSRSDRLAVSASVVPSPMRQCAVTRPSARACAPPKCRTRKPRDDFAPADRQQFAHQRQPPAVRFAVACLPIEHRGSHGRYVQRIGNLVAIFRIGLGEFLAPAVADGVGEFTLEIAEEREGSLRAPFLAHEQHRHHRRQQRDRERGLDRLRVRNAFEPVAERAGCRSGRGSAGN